nr:hypothetical protein 17 [Saccharospirillaceae bacterium]
MKNFQQHGNTIEYTATTDVSAGDPVELTDMVAVAIDDVPNGATGIGSTQGVFALPKVEADDISQGQQLYITGGQLTVAADDGEGSNYTPAGKAWAAAGNGATSVPAKINA